MNNVNFLFFSTESEQSLFAYLHLIILRNLLVSVVQDSVYRNFSRHPEEFNRELVTENCSDLLFLWSRRFLLRWCVLKELSFMMDGLRQMCAI